MRVCQSAAPGHPVRRRIDVLLLAAASCLVLAGCRQEEAAQPDIRPVRTIVTSNRTGGDTIFQTGHVEAQNEVTYSFRIGGRIVERLVDVGNVVKPGQVLARLDPLNEQSALRSAQAGLSAANAALNQASAAYDRQKHLLARGFTTRANYDIAEQANLTARSRVEDAEAQLKIAQDRLDFTELRADSEGTVTARRAEGGEVVQPGQAVVQVARQNGRDAVFNVPAQLLRTAPPDSEIRVNLTDDPSVKAMGRVREIAPQADPVTRTFAVRVGLSDVPDTMRLGATVTGRLELDRGPVIEIPASALTRANDRPAVWVVDPATRTVALRPIDVMRFSPSTVAVSDGLKPSEIVVTAGVQALHPGQKVRLLEPNS